MADSEKLTALKKAYAEIILNTAKEAAARIMVSERKAARYQRELFAAKDEALRMLLRLKQMFDSKATEAETTSLNQQRRIDELEAQLGEAEDIVKDLRAELRDLQDELERVTSKQMQPLSEQNSGGDVTSQAATSEENKLCDIATEAAPLEEKQLSTSGPVISPLPAAHCYLSPTFNGTYNASKCDGENGSHVNKPFVCNAEFASIVMRRKEPELYRNGCTQRIRAFERSLLGGTLSGQADDTKNQMLIKDDEDQCMYKKFTAKADDVHSGEKRPDEFKVIQANRNCLQAHHIPSFRRKRKRATRFRKYRMPSLPSTPNEAVSNNNISEEGCRTFENRAQKDPETPAAPATTSTTSEMGKQSTAIEVTKSDSDFRDCMVHNTTKHDKLLVDELKLAGLDAGCPESLESAASRTDLETVSVLLRKPDAKDSNSVDILLTQPMTDKFLKYTFQRKRKKECPSSPDRDSSHDDSLLKRKVGEKESGSLASQNSE